jgi:hypothetical protein
VAAFLLLYRSEPLSEKGDPANPFSARLKAAQVQAVPGYISPKLWAA